MFSSFLTCIGDSARKITSAATDALLVLYWCCTMQLYLYHCLCKLQSPSPQIVLEKTTFFGDSAYWCDFPHKTRNGVSQNLGPTCVLFARK